MLDSLGAALTRKGVVAGRGQQRLDALAELGHSRIVVHRPLAAIDSIQDGGNLQQSRTDFQIILVQQFGSIHKAKRRVGRGEVGPGGHATAGTDRRPSPPARPYRAQYSRPAANRGEPPAIRADGRGCGVCNEPQALASGLGARRGSDARPAASAVGSGVHPAAAGSRSHGERCARVVGIGASGRGKGSWFFANLRGWEKRGGCGFDNGQGEFPLPMDWRRA